MHDGCLEPGDPCPDCNASDPPRPPSDWLSLAKVDDADVRPDLDRHTREQRALLHNAPKSAPRQPNPGQEVWRMRESHTGRVQLCELRNDAAVGAGWDVMLLEDGEPLFSRRCANEHEARYVAAAMKKDLLRTGWAEA